MENDRLERCLLLDFYGELLTDKQRECCELHFNEDLSLGEIAEQLGISRQGVWDNVRRAESAMRDIENKTGLIRRFSRTRDRLEKVSEKLARLAEQSEGETRKMIESVKDEIDSMKLEV
ncbi:MAG: sigma factor-like helix-turn-helix DNA-binding protein [Eubacteriales bacterium]|nr:sigma factor-like helix-turn-helix DNA-binding protein [Eubacteriales bacterium]